MNTFVPVECFNGCAELLDNSRLNKQVAECAQIIRQISQYPRGRWCKHPAVKMWVGYDDALFVYMMSCERERLKRGMNKHREVLNIRAKFQEYDHLSNATQADVELPTWWGRADVHSSHAHNLYCKQNNLPYEGYVWPV